MAGCGRVVSITPELSEMTADSRAAVSAAVRRSPAAASSSRAILQTFLDPGMISPLGNEWTDKRAGVREGREGTARRASGYNQGCDRSRMKKSLQLLLVLFVLLCCIGCDQAVKALVRGALAFSPPVLLLNGAVRLQYTENPGAFLSLGAGLPPGVRYLFGVVLVGVTQLALFAFLIRSRNLTTLQRIGFSLFLAGGLGNWIDRIANHGR